MVDQPRSEIIKCCPIGKGLDAFRASLSSVCEDNGISCTPDALDQLGEEDIQIRAIDLLSSLLSLPATRLLRSQTTYGTLRNDILKLNSAVSSVGFDFDQIKPLLKAAIANESDNDIWDQVYKASMAYWEPIYKANSRIAVLTVLEGCIKRHESLYNEGLLHRDISISNLMINEGSENSFRPSFLIDLDFAIKESRQVAAGETGETEIRAFMAIGVLMNEQHSFMHDLESFFWVLFWICIHYNEAGEGRVLEEFERWNYVDTELLAGLKLLHLSIEGFFIRTAEENFTPYYQPLIPWVNRLRKAIFPWQNKDPGLYSRIGDILYKAKSDPMVAGT